MSDVVVSTLAEQEAIIEENLGSLFKVGHALMKIRDEELYREADFEGFVEYLESKPWGISRDYAYKQIAAAQVSTIVETPSLNEGQARELAPLLKKATPEVVKQVYAEVVAETNGKPTAKKIKEKVAAIIPPRKKVAPAATAAYLIEQAAFATGLAHSARRSFGKIPLEDVSHLIKEVEAALTRWNDIASELRKREGAAT